MIKACYLMRSDGSRPPIIPGDAAGEVPGEKCPHCGVALLVQGDGRRIAADDHAYEADAYCASCRGFCGVIRAEVSTLFGLTEDRAVLYGRLRGY